MANSSLAVREYPETERTLAFGGISGSYAKVGTPLAHASVKLILQNQTNAAVSFSWDGTNSHVTLAAGAVFTSDIQANRSEQGGALMASAGTQFWVSGTVASGAVYISSFFANNFDNK